MVRSFLFLCFDFRLVFFFSLFLKKKKKNPSLSLSLYSLYCITPPRLHTSLVN